MWATASLDELQRLIEPIGTSLAVLEACAGGRFRALGSNRMHERSTGLPADAIRGRWLEEFLPTDIYQRLLDACTRCVQTAAPVEYETEHHRFDGRRLTHTTLTPVCDAAGRVLRIIASSIDITTLRALEHETSDMAQRLQLALTGGMLGTWDWDVASLSVHIEEHDHVAFGTRSGGNTLEQSAWKERIHPEDLPRLRTARQATLRGDTPEYDVQYRLRKTDRWAWIHAYGRVVQTDANGRPLRACGVYRDITQQKEQEAELRALNAELEYRATHDGLTGALNHGAILVALEREIERMDREGGSLTLMLIDIDHFKAVNDTYGHPIGDEVLRGFVARLRGYLRGYDYLGRYGGEEFLIVSPNRGRPHAQAERLCRVVAGEPFPTTAGAVKLTASIGVADGAPWGDTGHWLNRVDEALYRAKAEGRNRVVSADPDASRAPRIPTARAGSRTGSS